MREDVSAAARFYIQSTYKQNTIASSSNFMQLMALCKRFLRNITLCPEASAIRSRCFFRWNVALSLFKFFLAQVQDIVAL